MMRSIYLSFSLEEEIGVRKKIEFQIKAFQNLNIEMESVKVKNDGLYFNEKFINKYREGKSLKDKILRKIDLYCCLKKLQNIELYKNIDFIYIRYFFTSPWSLSYFKFLKEIGIKIILEIPTYPYDQEIQKENIFTKWDKKYRNELKKYVDKIVTFSDDKEIFGVPCVYIFNGIDLEEVKLVEKQKENKEEINLIGVAKIAFWHGFDRMILSLAEYYKTNPKQIVKFHIVGDGDKNLMSELRKLVQENNLEKYVIFYGFKTGKELDEIYNKADIAVGCLANFRKRIYESGALKNKEYCAKGLPFVVAGPDYDFKNCDKFIYEVKQDESLIDIEKIVEWYKNLKVTPEEIRRYAEENLSWDKQMKKVIDSIKELD